MSAVIRTHHLGGGRIVMDVTLGQQLEPVLRVTAHGDEAIRTVCGVLGITVNGMVTDTIERGDQTRTIRVRDDVVPALEALDRSTEAHVQPAIEVMYPVQYFHPRYDTEVINLGFVVEGRDRTFMIIAGSDHMVQWVSAALGATFQDAIRAYRHYVTTEHGAADRDGYLASHRQQSA